MARPKHVAAVVGLIALVVFTIQSARKALREHGCDLTCYLDAGALALRGETPYDPNAYFEYLYSPFFAALISPLSLLPVAVASVLWSLLSALALWFTVRTVRELTVGRERPFDGRDLVALALLAVIAFRIVHANFANGQINLIVLGMAAAFLRATERGQHVRAAAWLTLAVQCKTVPILLLGMLLARGRWRTIAWTAALGAITSAVPFLLWGSDTITVYRDWFAMIDYKLRTYTVDMGAFTTDADGNREYFTLRGMLATLWPATSPSAVAKYACLSIVFGGTLWLDRRLHARRVPLAAVTAFALWLLAALLTSPMSEKHHLALLLPAATLGLYATIDADRRLRIETVQWAGAVAAAMLLSKPFPHGPWYFVAVVTSYAWALRAAAQRFWIDSVSNSRPSRS